MKKLLYIVLDGLGDLPIPELGNKTPLEAANKPNLDKLAKDAKTGLVYPVGKNIAPESDVAVISLLGYEADKYYTGRGPLEAFSEGLDIKNGDLAFRVNFATKDSGSDKIIDRRVGRNLTTEEATALAKEINKKVKLTSFPASFIFKNTVGHRGILVIKRKRGRLSSEVTNTDPAYEKEGSYGVAKAKFENVVLKCYPTENSKNSKEAVEAAALTNEFVEKSSEVLEASRINKKRRDEGKPPANVILARDAGDRLPSFPDINKTWQIKFGCLVEMPVERGIALLTGMEIIKVPLPTGNPQKDYPLRTSVVLKNIKKFDVLYIHLKGPDEPAHDGNFKKKVESIEAIDKFFFGNLIPSIDLKDFVIVVTADHSTPCKMRAHSADPVPLMITGAGITGDGFSSFGEVNCKSGSLGELTGPQLMPLFMKYIKGA